MSSGPPSPSSDAPAESDRAPTRRAPLDLPDDEDSEPNSPALRSPKREPSTSKLNSSSHKPRVKREFSDAEFSDAEYDNDNDDDDDRRHARHDKRPRKKRRSVPSPPPSKRSKHRRRDEDDEDDEDGRGRARDRDDDDDDDEIRPKNRPSRRGVLDDNDITDARGDEDEVKPERKKSAFEAALEKTKARRVRHKELDPAVIEADALAFLERMMKARDDDLKAFKKGQPALEKIRMLREVEMMMMKVQHREYLLDNMLLPVIRAWLDRLPDGTLPNVEVRTTLLKILLDLRVDDDWVERLERSQGLGKVIHFLSRNDDYETNRRIAERIMRKWARPVYNMNSNFHDLLDEFDKPNDRHRAAEDSVAAERKAAMKTVRRLKTTEEKLRQLRSGKQDTRVMASIPRPTPFLFTTVAEGSTAVDESVRREVRSNKAKARKVNRTMSNLRQMNRRNTSSGTKPSINGR